MPDTIVATRPVVRWKGQADARFGDALLACSVTMPPDGMDSCELNLIDWDVRSNPPRPIFDDVALGDEIAVEFGVNPASVLFRGYITGLESQFGTGGPQLTLLAEDALHRLARHRQSYVYEQQSFSDIVSTLAGRAQLQADCSESTQGTWYQLNETDLGFLRRIAGALNLPIRVVDGNTLRVKAPSAPNNPTTIDLTTSASVELRLCADLNRQPTSMTSAGYDVATGQAVTADSSSLTPAPSGTTAASKLGSLNLQSPWRALHPPPNSQAQATAMARGAFAKHAAQFLHGSLISDGDPSLVAGSILRLSNVGSRFAGDWSILAATHRFDLQQGYRCLLRLAKGAIA